MASRSRLVRLTQQGAPNTDFVETDPRVPEAGVGRRFMALAFLVCGRWAGLPPVSGRNRPGRLPSHPVARWSGDSSTARNP
ncbi:hypothetical protein Saso_19610 [Streptomyces asoensis]|uniref:Uncharacterized protein n=1 Tax=Streptomyces asoensis TaxID=249586 RepID=A0ABQ3RWS5_9ACTN|nr:hypothetical protein GCM10010496_12200 [Streptomyces asoensis]GHI60311.1 hypothetical protein Saso_19610 [Streptomyces asoensis]